MRSTVAPRSASSIAHIGPGPMPVNSTILIPASGPTASLLCDPAAACGVLWSGSSPLLSSPSWHPNRGVSCLENGRAPAVARDSMAVEDDDPPRFPHYLPAHRCV